MGEFKSARIECFGRRYEDVTPKNIKKTQEIISNNRKVEVHEVAEIVLMTNDPVHILHEYLGSVRKKIFYHAVCDNGWNMDRHFTLESNPHSTE